MLPLTNRKGSGISDWRAARVPPSTRENPFPPAEVMEPIRKAERADAESWYALDEVDAAAVEARLRRIRDVISERRRYLEIMG